MLNVACLNRAPFAEILSGAKRNEYRLRKRPDPRLEAVQRGETLIFLERGTERALKCTVSGCKRFDPHDPADPDGDFPDYCYDVAFHQVRLIAAPGARHLQGWSRREAL